MTTAQYEIQNTFTYLLLPKALEPGTFKYEPIPEKNLIQFIEIFCDLPFSLVRFLRKRLER